ncbi:MAG: ZPR1 zinc finger domain-containing protein [Promethearchaeota archaeon]
MHETTKVFSHEKCPICQRMTLSQVVLIYVDRLSNDETLLFTTKCSNCTFKHADTMPVRKGKFSKARRNILTIEHPDDLHSKVYRAPTATIKIPALGLEVEPSGAGEAFVTNVEGILYKFRETSTFLLSSLQDARDTREVQERLTIVQSTIAAIDKALGGALEFDLVMDDPEGYSYIIPSRDEILILEDVFEEGEEGKEKNWKIR